ncbi:conserved hypothetical protein [Paecilomyces variotii No. 5]|uniref:Uncharacterized protein n=1 Tax=Byssochlamys spectabilis (strain No. 5 / NBRC 109023) TaxID=1356009 RepID=V5GG43_BYSSN|nr:conserved hypothetical protein [Paecilomyces variotii No. 5]
MSEILPSTIAGSVFGTALTLSGVYRPGVITSQLQLTNFHMLKVFLSASAVSALAVALYEKTTRRELSRRPQSNLGLIRPYDGNIIGGAMVGVGMALTGACPGTVLVQVGTGISSGRYAILGGILGGILYTFLARKLRKTPSCGGNQAETLGRRLGMSPTATMLMFEMMCLSVLLAARYFAPGSRESFLRPETAGLVIGVAQLVALVLTRSPVGVSTSYEDVGRWFWDCCGCGSDSLKGKKTFIPTSRAISFAGGIVASSFALSRAVPGVIFEDSSAIPPARGILGGLIMVLGARTAGGCPSGHGISGMSMFSISSFVTVASMFAGGIGLSLLL